ncbi:hypothetical protein L195_g042453 [Trifolium pratense]|uniref:Uncharacterized protein n=1 Tax=Trifolium pratense TaxID=57577 RepID=A0A2K3M6H5_TRIPR|nr:hypothetical protein L195_g042453 [Trifolium pratense]
MKGVGVDDRRLNDALAFIKEVRIHIELVSSMDSGDAYILHDYTLQVWFHPWTLAAVEFGMDAHIHLGFHY